MTYRELHIFTCELKLILYFMLKNHCPGVHMWNIENSIFHVEKFAPGFYWWTVENPRIPIRKSVHQFSNEKDRKFIIFVGKSVTAL